MSDTELSLISDAAGAVPLTLLRPGDVAAWLEAASPCERTWLTALDFKAGAGKWAPVPGEGGKLARILAGIGEEEPVWALAGLPAHLPAGTYCLEGTVAPGKATALALGWALGSYAFTRYKARKHPPARLVWPETADRGEVARLARGLYLARDLVNTPAETMGPAELAEAAAMVAGEAGARLKVIIGDDLLQHNYPMIHAVGRASVRAPRLIDLCWGEAGAPKVTLVGKGVCFDSGGLDLKPSGNMRMMKKDMGGAAIMLGLARALMDAKPAIRLRLLVPAVENSVSGNAIRPLDILPTRAGKTVEIGNTDAEGRLILCDALAEAGTEEPALLLDCATLTGAARVALGTEMPALFSNDDGLAADLLRAGTAQADPLWRLPLHQPYRGMLDSKLADLNSAPEGGFAGAITAALFLQEFVPAKTPWAHLDVYAWNAKSKPGRPEGGEAQALRAVYAMIRGRFG